ncbi:low affinity immunoglobulin gamma Fc region receptor III-like isoform X2 [Xyrichtys novacula]|nr:low affinity immunoglobulin gamma Fc region receptor III-like isoform X2 [Xyrichtys novacula]
MKPSVLFLIFCVLPASPSPDSKNEVLHLHMVPSRSQFFKYDSVYLSCEASSRGGLPKWIISKGVESCLSGRKSLKVSTCNLSDLYPFDSGLCWCETESGDRGPPVNIRVTGGPVILESPVYPVMEGDSVALRCAERETSSRLTDFYKDGRLIGSSSTGNMTLHRVSKSNEGLYMCNISGVGSSLSNWLSVRVPDRPDPDPPVMPVHRIICHVVTGIPYLLSTIMLALIHRDKRRASQFVAVDRRHCVVMEME